MKFHPKTRAQGGIGHILCHQDYQTNRDRWSCRNRLTIQRRLPPALPPPPHPHPHLREPLLLPLPLPLPLCLLLLHRHLHQRGDRVIALRGRGSPRRALWIDTEGYRYSRHRLGLDHHASAGDVPAWRRRVGGRRRPEAGARCGGDMQLQRRGTDAGRGLLHSTRNNGGDNVSAGGCCSGLVPPL